MKHCLLFLSSLTIALISCCYLKISNGYSELNLVKSINNSPETVCQIPETFTYRIEDGKGYVPIRYRNIDKKMVDGTLYFPAHGLSEDKSIRDWLITVPTQQFPCYLQSDDLLFNVKPRENHKFEVYILPLTFLLLALILECIALCR